MNHLVEFNVLEGINAQVLGEVLSSDSNPITRTFTDLEFVNLQNLITAEEIRIISNTLVPETVVILGSLASQPFSGSASVTHVFTVPMNGFYIINDGAASLTFTVGTDTFPVPVGKEVRVQLAPFTNVTVTSTVAFRAWGLL